MSVAFSTQQLQAWSEQSIASARVVLPLLFELQTPRSVVDVGCLFGGWSAVARELGVQDTLSVDGGYIDETQLAVPLDTFHAHDLAQPLRLEREFDLAICLEVAHYLPSERAGGLVSELCRLAPLVLFSAAIPHQGGHGHVNEQWPSYWARRFVKCGYTPVDCVRDEVWEEPDVAPWYAQNTLLYVRGDAVPPAVALNRGWGRSPARVHPSTYMTYAGGRYQAWRRRASGLRVR